MGDDSDLSGDDRAPPGPNDVTVTFVRDAGDDEVTLAAGESETSAVTHAADDGAVDLASSRHQDASPSRIFGDYELLTELARGGMGVVYKARQRNLNRLVALKMILAGELAGEDEVRRFHAEARAAAHLDHPGIVPIFEVGRRQGRIFYSMALIEGQSLAARVKDGPLAAMEAAIVVQEVAEAMHYAHQQGVIHRDLKPHNILVGRDGRPRVTDFGLAKQTKRDSNLTGTGQILGTPSYMPPEQAAAQTERVGPHSDVYSLGAILYCLLVGRPPFHAANPVDTLRQVLEREPVSPRELNPQVPRDLETICLKCLEKEPARRYASAQALADELQRFLNKKPILARPVTRAQRLVKWSRREPKTAALLAAVFLSLLVGAIASTHFGLRANEQASKALEAQGDLRTALGAEKKAKSELSVSLAETSRQLALKLIDQGIAESEAGQNMQGMLSFLKAYTIVDSHSPERENLLMLMAAYGEHIGQTLWHDSAVSAVAFSPDGRSLVTGSMDKTARVWDVESGLPRGEPMRHEHFVQAVAFSPDEKSVLTGSMDGTARLWDAATGKPRGQPMRHDGSVFGAAFSPDGKWILTSSADKTVRMWDANTTQPPGEPFPHVNSRFAAAFSPDGGAFLTSSSYNVLQLWSTDTRQPLGAPMHHVRDVTSAAFSTDGQTVLTGDLISNVHCWDAATGKPLGISMKHNSTVSHIAFSPDGQTVILGGIDAAGVYNFKTGMGCCPLLDHPEDLSAVAFSRDGTSAITGCLDGVRFWDSATGKLQRVPIRHEGRLNALALSPDGQTLLTASSDGAARLYAAARRPDVIPHDQEVHSLAYSRDGESLITGCANGMAQIWKLPDRTLLRAVKASRSSVTAVAFSPDGTVILTGTLDGEAQVWDAETAQPVGSPMHHKPRLDAAIFSPDGLTVYTAGSLSNAVLAWNTKSGELLGECVRHQNGICAIALSDDGQFMLVGDLSGVVQQWDVKTWTPVGAPMRHDGYISAVAYNSAASLLVTGSSDKTARLWDAQTGRPITEPLRHPGEVSDVAFAPDGRSVLVGSYDGTALLWDVRTGKPCSARMRHLDDVRHVGDVRAVAYAPDGKTLFTGGSERSAHQWNVPQPLADDPERIRLWIEALCGRTWDENEMTRKLTSQERLDRELRLDKLGGPPVSWR
jgi:WD40 repeat protein/tRNA A-37 threonylcarbamoyl transferase component Bud32